MVVYDFKCQCNTLMPPISLGKFALLPHTMKSFDSEARGYSGLPGKLGEVTSEIMVLSSTCCNMLANSTIFAVFLQPSSSLGQTSMNMQAYDWNYDVDNQKHQKHFVWPTKVTGNHSLVCRDV